MWHRIFDSLELGSIVLLTRRTSKAVFEWSDELIDEVKSRDTVCPHRLLQNPRLHAISLPFGFFGWSQERSWFNVAGVQLGRLELGIHPSVHLESLVSRFPALSHLLLGSMVTTLASSWHFLPRGLLELSLGTLQRPLQFDASPSRHPAPQFPSLFEGLPTNIKKFVIHKNTSTAGDVPLFSSLLSSRHSFLDFLLHCASTLPHLEHLQAPDALDIFICVDDLDDQDQAWNLSHKESPEDNRKWLIPSHLFQLSRLSFLSCRTILWETRSEARVAILRSESWRNEIFSKRLASNTPSGTPLNQHPYRQVHQHDLRTWTLKEIAPNLEHFSVLISTLRRMENGRNLNTKDKAEYQEEREAWKSRRKAERGVASNKDISSSRSQLRVPSDCASATFPSSITSLHILAGNGVWPSDIDMPRKAILLPVAANNAPANDADVDDNFDNNGYEDEDYAFRVISATWALPDGLIFASLPSIDSIVKRPEKWQSLQSLSILYAEMESLPKRFFSPPTSPCRSLTHLNLEYLHHRVSPMLVYGEVSVLEETKRELKSLTAFMPSIAWFTAAGHAVVLPQSKTMSPRGYEDWLEQRMRYIPSLFNFGLAYPPPMGEKLERTLLATANPLLEDRWYELPDMVVAEMKVAIMGFRSDVAAHHDGLAHPSLLYAYYRSSQGFRSQTTLAIDGEDYRTNPHPALSDLSTISINAKSPSATALATQTVSQDASVARRTTTFIVPFLRLCAGFLYLPRKQSNLLREFPSRLARSLSAVAQCCVFGLALQKPLRPAPSACPPPSYYYQPLKKGSTVSSSALPSSSSLPASFGDYHGPLFTTWPLNLWFSASPAMAAQFCRVLALHDVVLDGSGDDLRRSLLHHAIASRQVERVRHLLELKVEPHRYYIDIDIPDTYGTTARQEALQSGHHEMVALCKARIAAELQLGESAANKANGMTGTSLVSLVSTERGHETRETSLPLSSPSQPSLKGEEAQESRPQPTVTMTAAQRRKNKAMEAWDDAQK